MDTSTITFNEPPPGIRNWVSEVCFHPQADGTFRVVTSTTHRSEAPDCPDNISTTSSLRTEQQAIDLFLTLILIQAKCAAASE